MSDTRLDPRFQAGLDLLGRTGVRELRIAYSDEEQGLPVVWWTAGKWKQGNEAAAALDPLGAVMRLCERVIDGGVCTHCGQLTIFDDSMPMGNVVENLLDSMGCRYAWDPELSTFRRSCEGDT